ncbi:DUF1569 domain-containing protein [Paludisphaera soli]|uniref:DUF1569 domain-containing protein n=1 Tax=Paludisphaera soli TaxID=2712865 RepID=UPI0013EE0122|nr:DUF1569 domain-containing protein [Paludisphaera soli]
MSERRTLELDGIEAILPEVDRLTAGHVTVGSWTLAQICDHLTRSINLSLDLPAATEPPTREQAVYRRFFFRSRAFPEGQGLAHPSQEPDAGLDLGMAVEALRAAVDRLAAHDGPFAAHPVLGPMSRDEWLLFHARHAAHHLGFAVSL